jgi:hypothetical protein
MTENVSSISIAQRLRHEDLFLFIPVTFNADGLKCPIPAHAIFRLCLT